ncbi:MAG TPA: serine hydrolase domain-containing protein, partial [Candidatus Baltobacteraceae bacterium]|nr:serine hydrolase domain-containing protein [Candidatus Baltobacteraceae bacterium]
MLPPYAAKVDAIVRTVMREEHIAGVAVGIARRGSIIYLKGYGSRDVAAHLPVDGYTIFRIGSVTKEFTAAAIMQLADRGSVSLDAAAGSYLPLLPQPDARVTVAQLLNQTSGIPSYTDPGATAASALAAPLLFEPGASWAYSNTNYLLLGRIAEAQTHRPYANLLDETIFAPLKLRSTAYGVPRFANNAATGYRYDGTHYVAIDDASQADRAYAAGALASNVPDLLQWLEALRTGRVVSGTSFARMSTQTRLPDGAPTHYGFGFFIRNWYGWHAIEHNGNVDGFSADDALVLDDGLAVAVLTNADRADIVPLTESLVALADPPRDRNLYADRPRPPENENPSVTATIARIFADLQRGTIDRTLLTPSLSASFTRATLQAR